MCVAVVLSIAIDVLNTTTRKVSLDNWKYKIMMTVSTCYQSWATLDFNLLSLFPQLEGICISSSTIKVTSCSKTNGTCYTASTEYSNVTVATDIVNDAIVIESTMMLPEDELFDTHVMIDSDTQLIVFDTSETF